MPNELSELFAQRRMEQERNLKNKAGQGSAFAVFQTVGQGPFEFEEAVDFVLAFQEEPMVSYGSYISSDALRTLLDLEDEDIPPFPVTSGFVTDWIQDDNDFYTGCYVGVRVTFPMDVPVSTDVDVVVRHYYKFEAIGLKGISA